jgi:hypothetical protein
MKKRPTHEKGRARTNIINSFKSHSTRAWVISNSCVTRWASGPFRWDLAPQLQCSVNAIANGVYLAFSRSILCLSPEKSLLVFSYSITAFSFTHNQHPNTADDIRPKLFAGAGDPARTVSR